MGGSHEKPRYSGELHEGEGGHWTVCRFKGGGVFEGGFDTPVPTMSLLPYGDLTL